MKPMSCSVRQHSSSHLRASYGLTPRLDHFALGGVVFWNVAHWHELADVPVKQEVGEGFTAAAIDFFQNPGEIGVIADAVFAGFEHPVARILFLDVGCGGVIGGRPQD